MLNYHYNTPVVRYQQPGYFNDPDFLIPDHPGLTTDEKKSLVSCKCGSGRLWSHFVTGHLQNANGGCLMESVGAVRLETCDLARAGQILGLPSGICLAGE